MHRLLIILFFVLTAVCLANEDKPAAKPDAASKADALKLRFVLQNPTGWKTSTDDVMKLLNTTADELICYFPDRKFPAIEVGPQGGPITYYDRGKNGEIRVRLNVEGSRWSQLVFQFAHEMGHILCDYKPHENKNKWFEESICETSSLYVLRKVSEKWKTSPAIKNSQDYAKHYYSYAQKRIDDASLPKDKKFADWFKENQELLVSRDGGARDQQTVIAANVMLPYFERDPKSMWAALPYLNAEKLTKLHTLEMYLSAWHRNCPDNLKPIVKQLISEFQVQVKE